MRLLPALVWAALVGMVASGCDMDTADSEAADPKPTAQVKKNAKYKWAWQLKDAAVAGGYECVMWYDSADIWTDTTGSCDDGTGDGATFSTFYDKAERDKWLKHFAIDPDYPDDVSDVLVGPNWIVGCDDDCPDLAKSLGGTVQQLAY